MVESTHLIEFAENSSWLELSRSAFINNINIFRKILPPHILLGCVLKGNAYGHGFLQSLEILHDYVDLIFVISPVDAFKIRKFEKDNELVQKRVVVLGSITAEEAAICAMKVIEATITDAGWQNFVPRLLRSEKERGHIYRPLKVHVHVDTGLTREGFFLSELGSKLEFLAKHPTLFHAQGVMSHFANTEDVTDQSYALEQMAKLDKAYEIITKKLNLSYKLEKHIAQSSASMIIPASRYDLARVGISIYGLWPSSETKLSTKIILPELPRLIPALTWKCQSQSIKKVESRSYIGYGCTCRAERDLIAALFPVGYFDGYPRLLSNKGYVLVDGVRCKILGRVMMNHIVVDVTDVTQDDTRQIIATLIGKSGKESITVDQIAEWAQTINYEIVTRIGAHLKRMVVDS